MATIPELLQALKSDVANLDRQLYSHPVPFALDWVTQYGAQLLQAVKALGQLKPVSCKGYKEEGSSAWNSFLEAASGSPQELAIVDESPSLLGLVFSSIVLTLDKDTFVVDEELFQRRVVENFTGVGGVNKCLHTGVALRFRVTQNKGMLEAADTDTLAPSIA